MQLLAALVLCTYTGKIVCTNSCQECGHKRLCIMLCTYIPIVPTYSEAGNPPLLSLSSTETTIKTISTAVKTIYATYSCLCIFLYSPDKTAAFPRRTESMPQLGDGQSSLRAVAHLLSPFILLPEDWSIHC